MKRLACLPYISLIAILLSCNSPQKPATTDNAQEQQMDKETSNSQTTSAENQPQPEPIVDLCATLDNSKYSNSSGWHIRFYNQDGNTYEFNGDIEAAAANGKVTKHGNELVIISGNGTGKFTLLENCNILIGNFKTKDFGIDHSFEYKRE